MFSLGSDIGDIGAWQICVFNHQSGLSRTPDITIISTIVWFGFSQFTRSCCLLINLVECLKSLWVKDQMSLKVLAKCLFYCLCFSFVIVIIVFITCVSGIFPNTANVVKLGWTIYWQEWEIGRDESGEWMKWDGTNTFGLLQFILRFAQVSTKTWGIKFCFSENASVANFCSSCEIS